MGRILNQKLQAVSSPLPVKTISSRQSLEKGGGNVSLLGFIIGLCISLTGAQQALAQQNTPRIGYVYPAGGQQGTTFQVTIGGQFLDGITNAWVSGDGIQATVIEHVKPLNTKQYNQLRDQLNELQDKKKSATNSGGQAAGAASKKAIWTAEDEKNLAEIRKKLANPPNRANPAIAETVTLSIKIASDTDPGERELRLETALGLTNPRVFCVGQLPEFSSKPAKEVRGPNGNPRRGNDLGVAALEPEMTVVLPATINGQIMPGSVDRFRFHAREGMHLVVAVNARELIPYLPDAVPGWFQASLTLYDPQGHELQYADHYSFHPDPVLQCEIPKDGEYRIEIRDSIYRGREDFVYRISVGELPFITSLFPLGGHIESKTPVELKGWNLSETSIVQNITETKACIRPFRVSKEKQVSNPALFAADTLPECLEREPNNVTNDAQTVMLPITINGRISQPGEWDIYRFEGHSGEEIVAEVFARRLNSPLDSVLKLTDSQGKQLAFNDDFEDKGSGLNTHHADSRLAANLPADGVYFLHLGDAQRKGGPEYGYRLRIAAPQPDYELRVVPSSINIRAGASFPLTVYALRKDGFSNEIEIVLKDAPKGFSLSGGTIPAQQEKARVTLMGPAWLSQEPASLSLEGRAIIQSRAVIHPAIPAEDMMQAFIYRHLVPSRQLMVDVVGRPATRLAIKLISETPVRIPVGGTASVRFETPTKFGNKVHLELSEPPEGVTLRQTKLARDGTEIVLACDSKARPGSKGNLIINVYPEINTNALPAAKRPNQRRVAQATLPAIPFILIDRKE